MHRVCSYRVSLVRFIIQLNPCPVISVEFVDPVVDAVVRRTAEFPHTFLQNSTLDSHPEHPKV